MGQYNTFDFLLLFYNNSVPIFYCITDIVKH